VASQLSFGQLLVGHASGEALRRLVRYAELLERWSKVHNLVRYSDRDELVDRHLADALAAREHFGGEGLMLDVGSGAGLPGVPLLAVCSGWRGVLLEPRQKRWAFLRLVVRELGLEAAVRCERYQEYSGRDGPFDAIVARALGDIPGLLAWARSHLAERGRILLWTTTAEEARLCNRPGWRMLSSPLPSLASGRLVLIQPCFT
jgi:16S rRNA (guanine527-N7)-methyltransferase